VPADASLLVEVELLEGAPLPDVDELEDGERIELAAAKKERGNWFYVRSDHESAVGVYAKGIKFLEDFPPKSPKAAEAKALAAKLHGNLANCHHKLGNDALVLEQCAKSLAIEPSNSKALYWQATIQAKRNDTEAAIKTIKTLLQHDPQNASARSLLQVSMEIKQS